MPCDWPRLRAEDRSVSHLYQLCLLGVLLCCVLVVLGRVQVMPMGDFGVVRSLFMIAGLVMFCGLVMVFGRVFVVVRGLFVMLMNVADRSPLAGLPGSRFLVIWKQNMVRFDEVFAKENLSTNSVRTA